MSEICKVCLCWWKKNLVYHVILPPQSSFCLFYLWRHMLLYSVENLAEGCLSYVCHDWQHSFFVPPFMLLSCSNSCPLVTVLHWDVFWFIIWLQLHGVEEVYSNWKFITYWRSQGWWRKRSAGAQFGCLNVVSTWRFDTPEKPGLGVYDEC